MGHRRVRFALDRLGERTNVTMFVKGAEQQVPHLSDCRTIHAGGRARWAKGCPDGAPYDALIATVGTTSVPAVWVAQVRPGDRLVVPLSASWFPPGLAILDCADTGAVGRLDGPASFMLMRAQATLRQRAPRDTTADSAHSTTDVHPYDLARDRAAAVAIGQRTPRASPACGTAPTTPPTAFCGYAAARPRPSSTPPTDRPTPSSRPDPAGWSTRY